MRSIHAPKACITDNVCITHAVHIVFRKERITQRSLICQVDKSGFFVGGPNRDRTDDLTDANRTLSQLSYRPIFEQGGCPAQMIIHFSEENATLFL